MTRKSVETLVIGSGVAGVLVARELARAGRPVAIVERGSFVPWREQIRARRWEADGPTSAHNHENDPGGVDRYWQYVYGVGGTCNAWTGNTPRLLPEDFELHSRYGVARDWPLAYEELEPYYSKAETALGVAGPALPAHPFSPQDEVLAPLLEPFVPMPQARPSAPVGGRPACCGAGECSFCPEDSRFSVLNGLGEVLSDPNVELIDETVAARLVPQDGPSRVAAVECVRAGDESLVIDADRVVVAANGIESAGLLMRSGIDHGDTGRNLLDHAFAYVSIVTETLVSPGRGASWATGASYTWYEGAFRSERAALLVYPRNTGAPLPVETIVRGLVDGRRGRALRDEVVDEWERTLRLVVAPDELPSAANRVTLSPRRDSFGLPLNRIHVSEPSDYQQRAIRHVLDDLPRRLAPLGVREVQPTYPIGAGSHLLGTLRMGTDDGAVVDSGSRHRRYENLFVAGGAVFPSMSPAHPTLTIAALAIRLGESLAGTAG
ncbi:MAG: GMC oxidoreductase [Thermoleophilaceae bacterium]